MNIVIAGGAGFIGTNLIQMWHKKYPKDTLYVLDNFSVTERTIFEKYVQGTRIRILEQNVRNLQDVQEVFEEIQPNILINLIDGSRTAEYLQTNIFTTANLLQAAKAANVSHYIHVSPASIYGVGNEEHDSSHRLLHEGDTFWVHSPQQVSKASADLLAQSYWKAYSLPTTILRLDHVYGPFESIDRLLPLVIIRAIQNRPIPLHIAAKSERSLLYVADAVRAIETVVGNNESKGRVYNVSAGVRVSVIEMIESVLTIVGRQKSLIEVDADAPVRQLGVLDTTRIEKDLSWEPKHSHDFYKQLEKTIEWYKNNEEWWVEKE